MKRCLDVTFFEAIVLPEHDTFLWVPHEWYNLHDPELTRAKFNTLAL